jgi:hypothetical protein
MPARLPACLKSALIGAALATALGPAAASLITLQTRYATDPAPSQGDAAAKGAYYLDRLQALTAQAPTSGYCDASVASMVSVSNQTACAGGRATDIGFAYQINFGLSGAQAGDFSFVVGPDFGRGGAVFLDGALLAVNTDDLWWSNSYANPAEIFSVAHLPLASGNHRLSIYGLEGCCDGLQSAYFQLGSGAWTAFASNDGLNPVQRVPEPASLALVLTALAVAAGRRRGASI